jgi:hypothetical protein
MELVYSAREDSSYLIGILSFHQLGAEFGGTIESGDERFEMLLEEGEVLRWLEVFEVARERSECG